MKRWHLKTANVGLGYLNKLEDECSNTYYIYFGRKPINTDYSALTEEIYTNLKDPKFKVADRVRSTKYKNIFSKYHTKNWSREILLLIFVRKGIVVE